MAKRARTPAEYDSPWKQVLQGHFRAFLEFFFADVAAEIDWTRGYESLDKELLKIARRAKLGKCLADKLFKVWLADGAERWILIHVEVQNAFDKDFEARMFRYNVAAYQMYNNPVVSLAALCDDRLNWRPTHFRYGAWGSTTEVTFRIAKLLDFGADVENLEANENPFAVVVLTNCKAVETCNDAERRAAWKLRIIKGLYRRDWSNEQIREFFDVIDYMMVLPKEFELAFAAEADAFDKENNVKYVSSLERFVLEREREAGLREGIFWLLESKFGAAGRDLASRIDSLQGLERLREFSELARKAGTLDELREHLG